MFDLIYDAYDEYSGEDDPECVEQEKRCPHCRTGCTYCLMIER